MADTDITQDPTEQVDDTPVTEPDVARDEQTTDDETLGEAGKKALEAERSARREAEKLAKEYEAKVKEFEDASKSDLEKLEERAAAAEDSKAETEAKLADAEARLLRYEVAAAKGLDLKHAHRLTGSTREEMEADADELAQIVRPRDDLDGGARGRAPVNTGGDMNDLLRRAAGRA